MTVVVNFIADGKGVEILASDIVYGHEVISANKEIASRKQLADVKFHIIDKSNCTEYNVSSTDLFEISNYDRIFKNANPDIIMAIVESKSLRYSLSQLWQQIVKKDNIKTSSFADRTAALNWINTEIQW